MATIKEIVGQGLVKGSSSSGTRRYHVSDTLDRDLAHALVDASAPAVSDGLVKQNVKVDELGGGFWEGTVRYGVLEAGEEGDISWSFEIGTQSFHQTQAREHLADYAAEGIVAPNHKGAVGVEGTPANRKVVGTDIQIPFFQWEEAHYVAYETVATHAFINTMEGLVGTINEEAFRIWGPAELLLLGVSGAKQGEEPVGLTYRFASSRTVLNLVVGDITVPEKLGHHYLWFEYQMEEQAEANALPSPPIAAHYERLYPDGDWSQLGLPDPWS